MACDETSIQRRMPLLIRPAGREPHIKDGESPPLDTALFIALMV